ncbi:PilX N-terminal domain-containing pilus assembly protein [Thioalkalivibrio sp. AKL19]|uniref:pilus assembly PilX family protein n=1 Tax=Thioalkalivibrio sp. AKL19 TaxID=1266914 RepID=UPI0004625235|nr:pilus assembly PilX N-terminal domain-containing protein [Thioalkalivibrio sp. AKL19]
MISTQLKTMPSRQKGVATLLVALIIMVAITLTVLFTAQTSILEERMAANEVRMKLTGNAAQAGIDEAIAFAIDNDDVTQQFGRDYTPDGRATWYRAAYVAPDQIGNIPTCPGNPANFAAAIPGGPPENLRDTVIWSCGWSDDLTARKGITIGVRGAPSLADPPTNPLITRGGVDTNGRARVFNAYNNLTIWSGGELDVTGNPGNTFIRNEDVARPSDNDPIPALPQPPNCNTSDPFWECTTDANMVGPDVIAGDLQLASLTNDQFFLNFMGQDAESYRDSVVTERDPESIDGMTNEVIWFDGDASLDGTVGTREAPVVLVVDGNADVTGNFEMHGVLYVRGDLRANGTPKFYGASVIEGETADIGGTPSFIYDPISASGAGNLGASGVLSGTWRDWSEL